MMIIRNWFGDFENQEIVATICKLNTFYCQLKQTLSHHQVSNFFKVKVFLTQQWIFLHTKTISVLNDFKKVHYLVIVDSKSYFTASCYSGVIVIGKHYLRVVWCRRLLFSNLHLFGPQPDGQVKVGTLTLGCKVVAAGTKNNCF